MVAHSDSCLSNHSSDIATESPSISINFSLKAHCKQINSISLIKNDERLSLVTTSDDMMVKVYSLQQQLNGPLKIELLGAIDLINPQNNLVPWSFSYENQENMRRNKETYKQMLAEIDLEGRSANHHSQNYRLLVRNPEKEKLDQEHELNAGKRH